MMKYILCILLPFVVASFDNSGESNKEKTTEAVVKAVANVRNKLESKEDKEAAAVADATMDVIKEQSDVIETVPDDVMEKAKQEAKKTFKELDEANVGTKAAADAAAKVAVAEVDGASDMQLDKGVKLNAEKAAVAAGEGVADHPTDESKALNEAIATVQKEEEKPGNVNIKKTEKGLLAKTKDAVSSLPSMAEGAVEEGVKAVPGTTSPFAFCILFAGMVAMVSLGYKYYEENLKGGVGLNVGFIDRSAMGGEFSDNSGDPMCSNRGRSPDVEFGDATYAEYKEMPNSEVF